MRFMSTASLSETVERFFLTTSLALLLLSSCGRTGPGHLAIIGGETQTTNPYPIVALLKPDSQGILFAYCAGTLVNSRTVVTAAHCSVDEENRAYDPATVYVVAGSAQPESTEAVHLAVAKVIPHENFDRSQMTADGDTLVKPGAANDIAVWQLLAPIPAAVTAALPSVGPAGDPLVDGVMLTVMGFGQKSSWESPFAPHTLSRAQIPYFSTVKLALSTIVIDEGRSKRVSQVHEFAGRSAFEFYAGGKDYPDTCKGDSGGGAMMPAPGGQFLLVGITSRGSLMCDRGGVYTLVGAYAGWLARSIPQD